MVMSGIDPGESVENIRAKVVPKHDIKPTWSPFMKSNSMSSSNEKASRKCNAMDATNHSDRIPVKDGIRLFETFVVVAATEKNSPGS